MALFRGSAIGRALDPERRESTKRMQNGTAAPRAEPPKKQVGKMVGPAEYERIKRAENAKAAAAQARAKAKQGKKK